MPLHNWFAEIWLGDHTNLLLAPNANDYGPRSANAKIALAAKGIYLEKPMVITEVEYEDGFSLSDGGLVDAGNKNIGVVFVVPDKDRATQT